MEIPKENNIFLLKSVGQGWNKEATVWNTNVGPDHSEAFGLITIHLSSPSYMVQK